MLKFLVDQNIPKAVSLFLSKQKFDVKLVKNIHEELTDKEIINRAVKENRIILSNDKDFIDLAVRNKKVNIIIFNVFSQSSDLRIDLLKQVQSHLTEDFGILILG